MDQLFPDWNFEDNFHLSTNKRSIRPEDELVELLWRDGQVVLQSQARREPQNQTLNPKPILDKQETINPKPNNTFLNPQETQNPKPNNTFLNPQETVSWIQYPPDDVDPFESDFSSHFFSSIGPNHPIEETIKHETQTMAPPKFKSSLTTLGPSHSSSNQSMVNQTGLNKNVERRIHQNANANANADTSSGGSSGCSYGLKNSKESGSGRSITLDRKRKHVMDNTDQESVSQSDLQLISTDDQIGINKSNQRSGSTRRSRAAEVHNLSERRRRDRINERMKALQELIPHCSKTDKASILDEAIDYLKSLQMQLQVMWMGSGMAAAAAAAATVTTPLMLPSSPYIGQISMQTPMQLPQFPVINGSAAPNHPGLLCQNPVQFQLQAQNRVLSEQLARYMGGFQQMPLATPQEPMEMLRFGSSSGHKSQFPGPAITDGLRMGKIG